MNLILGIERDYLHLGNQNSHHIIVTRNGHFFFLPVYEDCGLPLSEYKLTRLLGIIYEQAQVSKIREIGKKRSYHK